MTSRSGAQPSPLAATEAGLVPTRWAKRLRLRARRGRWRDPQAWRLGSGLVLFAFVLTHFLNHALGLVSVEAMEAGQEIRSALWRSWTGTVLLYGAFAVHIGFSMAKLVVRRSWRMPPWEAAQIGLGLTIPILLIGHILANRGLAILADYDWGYRNVLRHLWPDAAWRQSALLAIVWLHAMIGFHHWLKVKRWYAGWAPVLLAAAVLVPTVALLGWIAGARQAEAQGGGPTMTEGQAEVRDRLKSYADAALWGSIAALLAAGLAVRLAARRRGGPRVTYPGGRAVRGGAGATLLEISRTAGVPHASVCGGRGRCTTCRVLVLDGAADLPPPEAREEAALARVGAPPGVRLACQVRPTGPVTVRPLVPLREAAPTAALDADRWGVERRVTILFADLRGFTAIAERLYPYDAVFLLNRYFEVMTQAVERHGGAVDKFLGDGIMALFGVTAARGAGSRDALLAARDMLEALERLNQEFGPTLPEPLRMGVGLHMGPAVIGRVGGSLTAGLTALGDSVNIASRLENLNKEFDATLIASDAVLRASGLVLHGAQTREITVRGRSERLAIHVARDGWALADAPRAVDAPMT